MIEATGLIKKFGDFTALKEISFKIGGGQVYGLVGSNGSGKSTLLRLIAGVYEQDGGLLAVDNFKVFDNTKMKGRIFFLSDTPYFFNNSTLMDMADFYSRMYPNFSYDRLKELNKIFPINPKGKISNMSKGMQRQAALILAFAASPDYLLLDEAFDGLDPVMRASLKQLIAADIADRNITVIIASHNLRELEDLCDSVGLLHFGELVFNENLSTLKTAVHKIQAAFKTVPETEVFNALQVMKLERTGSLLQMVIKGDINDINAFFEKLDPIFFEQTPLTLEEVFIYELGGLGYDVNGILG